jgi:isopentenyl-diphosphate delta-isomerase
MDKDALILVDENDRETGTMNKLEAHQLGLLHRAFSILVWNSNNELLIHQRAAGKYHSGGLWTNTCCSHPMPGENILDAAHRRLQEEMGFDCDLQPAFSFMYRVALDNSLIENELDHVFLGISDTIPEPDPSEVSAYSWISLAALHAEMEQHPERFTHWFRLIIREHADKLHLNPLPKS